MTRSAHLGLALVLGLTLSPGDRVTAQQPADAGSMAPYWTVHIDEVEPKRATEFERLNIAENRGIHAILRRYQQPIKPVYEIVTTGAVYMSFRPRLSLSDIEKPSGVPDSVSGRFSTVTDSLDGPIHAALRRHYNQVWRLHKTDSYLPARPGYRRVTPGYIQLVSESVIPGREERYDALYDSLKSALQRVNYPWQVLLFTSSYGDGAYKFLWQADSKAEFLNSGDRAAVLAAVYGKTTARRMLEDWRSCLAASATVDAAPDREYTDLDSTAVWLGMSPR